MFSITLITMGKLKETFYISAAEEYKKRLGGYCAFTLLELPEARLPENPSPGEIEAGLQTLSPEHREVLILREIQQLSYDEIADVLSLDLGTVKSRINRGRRQLREFLLKQGNFLSSAASNKTERGL